MATSRIEIFEQILETDPSNTNVLFGLAKEYEKAGRDADLIQTLNRYLDSSDDEGNAYGMLAAAYRRAGDQIKARAAYQRGIEVALAHGHPSMAEEYRMTLSSDFESDA